MKPALKRLKNASYKEIKIVAMRYGVILSDEDCRALKAPTSYYWFPVGEQTVGRAIQDFFGKWIRKP